MYQHDLLQGLSFYAMHGTDISTLSAPLLAPFADRLMQYCQKKQRRRIEVGKGLNLKFQPIKLNPIEGIMKRIDALKKEQKEQLFNALRIKNQF